MGQSWIIWEDKALKTKGEKSWILKHQEDGRMVGTCILLSPSMSGSDNYEDT